ncbi:AAA family ATPase [Flavobacterium branchiarum]|uniref:AAA family ATPase n=1 Tax=Flavobacterium branchiarum TaxID=1114870 RepID=A0ABV5FQY4_9FLAO|nr:AAA family ATPase [Flavobacterium branchiarum]MDN3671662.1 AAA family ATPase [Flavobacterium branchiarum]
MALKRAVSVDEITKKKFIELELPPEFAKLLGKPERSGVWIIWGESFNGKTSFSLQLAKALTQSGKVFYNTLEEGARKSMQKAVISQNMQEVKQRFLIGNRENIEHLKERMRKKKSPDIIFIDSLQYTGLTKKEYKHLKEEFHNKLFIFISHADGKNPEGSLAKFVKYDADVKIRVEGYKAMCLSRLGGDKEPYVIWEQGAAQFDIKIK